MAVLGGKQPRTWRQTPPITITRRTARIDARVLLITRDQAGVRQRTFVEAVATLSETCW